MSCNDVRRLSFKFQQNQEIKRNYDNAIGIITANFNCNCIILLDLNYTFNLPQKQLLMESSK